MGEWWSNVRRGPAGAALLVSLIVVAAAIRFGPARTPARAGVYRTAEASWPDSTVTSLPIGVLQSASARHLRITGAVGAHLHRRHDETVVILSGRGRLRLGEETVDVGPGVVVQVPRGTVHSLEVTEGPVEAVGIFSPPFDGTDRVYVDE